MAFMSSVFRRLGHIENSIEIATRALDSYKAAKLSSKVISVLAKLARAYLSCGDFEKSR